jgi:HTH-type transcriptional regulator / antitoxin HipB
MGDLHDRADPLADVLRRRRRELGLSQAELADLAEVSVRSVHAAEHAKPTLRLDTLSNICAALGLEIHLQRRRPGGGRD